MKRITLTLTDEEYAELERRAAQERRTPREMAAYLVTRPPVLTIPYTPPTTYPQQWWQNPVISTDRTIGLSRCAACGASGSHLCNSGNFSVISSQAN